MSKKLFTKISAKKVVQKNDFEKDFYEIMKGFTFLGDNSSDLSAPIFSNNKIEKLSFYPESTGNTISCDLTL